MSIAKDIIDGLEDFLQKLKNDEPIEVTTVRRIETPDGPMHIREKGTLGQRFDGEIEEGIP